MKLFTLALLLTAALQAQEITGNLYGTVTDPSGASISGARITATSSERGNTRQSLSNEKGEWVLTQVPIGTYSLKVEATGFKAFWQSGIALSSEDNIKVDARLEHGNASESVTVTAEAPQVDSRSSALAATLGEKTILDMPLDGTLFVAFFRNTGLNYPPPDAIAEVRIQTSNYTAEYGRNPGTSMNVVTKSGTNVLHGSAWEFARNSAFNARSFFAKSVNKLVENQYGGTLGGPVIKNKLFLFGSYQGLKVRGTALSSFAAKPLASPTRPSSPTPTEPTAAVRAKPLQPPATDIIN